MNMRPSEEFKKLNDEQKQSLDWTRSIAIRANAGSGKTTVLVQRIVQILHNHRDLKLDNIVAITFTRKAGAQLKEKLHGALTRCVASPTSDEDRKFWQAQLDGLPHCPIGTIDSLCHRLLKEAIEAGMIADLDPGFGILDGIDRTELLDQAIRATEIELKESKSSAWEQWLKTQGRHELNRALRMFLYSNTAPPHFVAALNAYQQTGFDATCGMLRLKALVQLSSHFDLAKREIRDALAELQGLSAKERAYKAIIPINDALESLLEDSSSVSLSFLNCMREALLTSSGDPRKDKLYVDGEPKCPTLHRLSHEWQAHLKSMKFEPQDKDGVEITRQLIQIYEVAHRHFHALCREANRYDYGYLAQRVDELLSNDQHADRLTEHYRFILVDEFQDTNEQQWRIVAGLAGVDPAKPVANDKLMIVGDPQQSIYRFRQADPTVFERIIGLIRDGNAGRMDEPTAYDRHLGKPVSADEQRSGLMRLKKNYRSRTPLPIRIIDRLSVHALKEVGTEPQPLEAGRDPSDETTEVIYLYPTPAEVEADEPIEVEAGADPSQSTEEPSPIEQLDTNQLDLVARELIKLHDKKTAWKDMAILLRSRRTHLVNLEEVLRDAKIPYQLVGGLGFWQRQEVRDLVCLANCLANGNDELALFAVLRGPLCGLNDSELLFLSMLGGRKLLKGLQQYALLNDGKPDWAEWHADEAMTATLQAAFAQIPDERKTIIQHAATHLNYDGTWRQRVDRMPHSDLLLTALDESGAWGVYTCDKEGERRLANLRLFFNEVRLLEASRAASLADTARRLKTLVDESTNDEQAELTPEDNDAVQVMTVHAAKGLEFGVVAVIGLERRFKTDAESIVLLDRFQHLRRDVRDSELAQSLHGLPVISFRDPEMPLQRIKPLLHQALGKIERELLIEEEARIFHVAITRAERVLILAGAGSNAKTWPPNNSWQKWVHEALGLDRDIDEGTWTDASNKELRMRIVRRPDSGESGYGPGSLTLQSRALDLQPLREKPRRRTIAATALADMLKMYRDNPEHWAMRYRHHVQPRAGIIPAELIDSTTRDKTDEVGKTIGTLVHRALEMGAAFPKSPKDRRALLLAHAVALTNDRGADPDEPGSADSTIAGLPNAIAEKALEILLHVLPNNPFKGLLDADGESEVDFALPVNDWIVTGRFDRLIRGDKGWQIVDWKTDDQTVKKIVDKYSEQMKLYALALLESLPNEERAAEIVVHLAMTGPRSSQALSFSANELAEYRRELERALPPI